MGIKDRLKKRRSSGSKKRKSPEKTQKKSSKSASIFGAVNDIDAPPRRNAAHIKPGDYLLRIQKATGGPSDKEKGVNYQATEFKVLFADAVDEEHSPNPTGSLVSKALMLKGDYPFQEVTNLVAAAMGVTEADVFEDDADFFIQDDGEAFFEEYGVEYGDGENGVLVWCEARKNNRGYTDLYYMPVTDEDLDEIDELLE